MNAVEFIRRSLMHPWGIDRMFSTLYLSLNSTLIVTYNIISPGREEVISPSIAALRGAHFVKYS